MNVIFLSPYFPSNYQQFPISLRNWGINVLALGDLPYDFLSNELKFSITEYYKVENMDDYNQLFRAVAFFSFKYGKIDRIDSLNEHWLEKEAMLRTDFNITGIKMDSIYFIKNKSMMKQKFIAAGIPVARGKVINDLKTAFTFIQEVGYPVIAKPDKGVGALNTYKIHNQEELTSLFDKNLTCDYIFEEFISGQILSFDGLTDKDGNAVFYTSHVFQNGVMETVNDDLDIYYYSLREIPADLTDYGFRVLKAFDVRERFFHFEFFRRYSDGQLVALEVNMRPPGGFTTDMFNYANNINIYQEWANIIVHNKFYSSYDRSFFCCYIGRKNSKKYVHSQLEIIEKYNKQIQMFSEVSGVFSSALGNFCYIIRDPEIEKINEIIEFIHQKQ
jgi:biotin carboxylase